MIAIAVCTQSAMRQARSVLGVSCLDLVTTVFEKCAGVLHTLMFVELELRDSKVHSTAGPQDIAAAHAMPACFCFVQWMCSGQQKHWHSCDRQGLGLAGGEVLSSKSTSRSARQKLQMITLSLSNMRRYTSVIFLTLLAYSQPHLKT